MLTKGGGGTIRYNIVLTMGGGYNTLQYSVNNGGYNTLQYSVNNGGGGGTIRYNIVLTMGGGVQYVTI